MKYEKEYNQSKEIKENFIILLKKNYGMKKISAQRRWYEIHREMKLKEIIKVKHYSRVNAIKYYNNSKNKKKLKNIVSKQIGTKKLIENYDKKIQEENKKDYSFHNDVDAIKPGMLKLLLLNDMKKYGKKLTNNFLKQHGFKFEEIEWLKINNKI